MLTYPKLTSLLLIVNVILLTSTLAEPRYNLSFSSSYASYEDLGYLTYNNVTTYWTYGPLRLIVDECADYQPYQYSYVEEYNTFGNGHGEVFDPEEVVRVVMNLEMGFMNVSAFTAYLEDGKLVVNLVFRNFVVPLGMYMDGHYISSINSSTSHRFVIINTPWNTEGQHQFILDPYNQTIIDETRVEVNFYLKEPLTENAFDQCAIDDTLPPNGVNTPRLIVPEMILGITFVAGMAGFFLYIRSKKRRG